MPQDCISFPVGTTVDSTNPVVPSVILSSQIHAATRVLHTRLNRLITARLPLCLPPYADSPFLYLVGLRRFTGIYYAFEDALRSIGSEGGTEHDHGGPPKSGGTGHNAQAIVGTAHALQALYLPKLARTQKLRNDISSLEHRLRIAALLRDIFQDVSQETQDFSTHISRIISEKPHIILAYTWIMYMALFNGGRWMRSKLLDGGNQFWTGVDDSAEHAYLSFWLFDGDSHGEDIKEDFKARFLTISESLTDEERNDAVQEAVFIFEKLIRMVEKLDDDCGGLDGMNNTTAPSASEEKRSLPFGLAQHIQRL